MLDIKARLILCLAGVAIFFLLSFLFTQLSNLFFRAKYYFKELFLKRKIETFAENIDNSLENEMDICPYLIQAMFSPKVLDWMHTTYPNIFSRDRINHSKLPFLPKKTFC